MNPSPRTTREFHADFERIIEVEFPEYKQRKAMRRTDLVLLIAAAIACFAVLTFVYRALYTGLLGLG